MGKQNLRIENAFYWRLTRWMNEISNLKSELSSCHTRFWWPWALIKHNYFFVGLIFNYSSLKIYLSGTNTNKQKTELGQTCKIDHRVSCCLCVFQPLSFLRFTTLDVVGRSTPSPMVWDSTTSSLTGYQSFYYLRQMTTKRNVVTLMLLLMGIIYWWLDLDSEAEC